MSLSGRLYERLTSFAERRVPLDLYHSALIATLSDGPRIIEQAPVVDVNGSERGVVSEGPVAFRFAARFRLFRYENRCWLNGVIPDIDQAVSSPVRLVDDIDAAQRIVDLLPLAPTYVWGRDQLDAGEMWNSNSLIAWVLSCSHVGIDNLVPPSGGRAPGWNAGIVAASRDL